MNYNKNCLENKMESHENISLSCFLQIFEQKMTQKSRKKTKKEKQLFLGETAFYALVIRLIFGKWK